MIMPDEDKELLTLAAKAYGVELIIEDERSRCIEDGSYDYFTWTYYCIPGDRQGWNPLNCDGDALRLAVKLNMDILQDPMDSNTNNVDVCSNDYPAPNAEESGCMCWATEERNNDPYDATRRAIVRAAAEIGRTMG